MVAAQGTVRGGTPGLLPYVSALDSARGAVACHAVPPPQTPSEPTMALPVSFDRTGSSPSYLVLSLEIGKIQVTIRNK